MLWSKFPQPLGRLDARLTLHPKSRGSLPLFFLPGSEEFRKISMANFSEKMTDFRQLSVFSGNHLKCPAAQTKFSGSPGEMFILVRREASADPIRMDLTFGNSKFVAFPCLFLRRALLRCPCLLLKRTCLRTCSGVCFSAEHSRPSLRRDPLQRMPAEEASACFPQFFCTGKGISREVPTPRYWLCRR